MNILTKNERNAIKALRNRENRLNEKRMVVEGDKCVIELLKSSIETKRIYVTNGVEIGEIRTLADNKSVEVIEISSKDMGIMSSRRTAPGILALGQIVEFSVENVVGTIKNAQNQVIPTLMILDDLADPGNVGTLIRTADWFGISGIVCSPRTADIWNPKTIQSSMGSVFRIPICTADPLDVISSHGLKAVALDAGGDDIFETKLLPDAIIIGSESHGLSDGLIDACDATWAIPGKGNAESLNAAIAGAIVTSELSRRVIALSL